MSIRMRPSGAFFQTSFSSQSPRLIFERTASSEYPVSCSNFGIVTNLVTLGNPRRGG